MDTKVITILISSVATAVSSTALAADNSIYAGVGFGKSSYDISASDIDQAALAAGFSTASSTVDEDGNAWKVFAGYRFNPNFAIEGGWVDLGEADTSTVTTGPAATATGNVDASGLFVDAVGTLPLGVRLSVFGKAGIFAANVEARVVAVSGGAAATVTADDDSMEAKLGVGLNYDFNARFGARLEYERYFDVGGDNTGEGDVDLFMLGLYARF